MDKSHPLSIYTLLFPQLGKMRREAFLKCHYRHATQFAVNKALELAQWGGNAGYFHEFKDNPQPVPVRIYGALYNGWYTLRAYTQPAIDTLLLWERLWQQEYPAYGQHLLRIQETVPVGPTQHTFTYQSRNYIPFRDCAFQGGQYVYPESGKPMDAAVFTKRIRDGLKQWCTSLDIPVAPKDLTVRLEALPTSHKSITALYKKTGDTLLPIKKYAFSLRFTTALQLPTALVLGQNKSFGNGVFERISP